MSSAVVPVVNKQYYDSNILRIIQNSDLWIDFSDEDTITTSNVDRRTLTGVTDKSVNPKTMTVNGTGYYEDSTKGYFTNNAINNYIYTTEYTGPTGASPNETMFVVASVCQATGMLVGAAASGVRWVGIQNRQVKVGTYPNFQVNGVAVIPFSTRVLVSVTISSNIVSTFINGKFDATGTINNTASGTTRIGQVDNTWYHRGNIFEVIVFGSTMPDSQRQAIERYLIEKWKITTTISSPLSVTGCTLWLDGNDESSVTYTTGTAISQWNDKSGNDYHATQETSARQPAYDSSLKGVTFTSANLNFMNSLAPFERTNEVLFIVYTWQGTASGTTTPALICSPVSTNSGRSLLLNTGTAKNVSIWNGTSAAIGGQSQQPINVPNIVEFRNSINTGNTFSYLLSGNTADGTVNVNGISFSTTAATHRIGSGNNTTYFQGTIHEVILFNRILSGSERKSIRDYLIKKWNIDVQAVIDTRHPYATVPPFFRYFQPTDIPNCSLWLDASDNTTLTLDGSNYVTQLRDKSGNNYNATGVGNLSLQTLGNNNKAIFFDNSTGFLTYNNNQIMNNGRYLSVFAVGTLISPPTANVAWLRMVSFGDPDFSNNLNVVAIERFNNNNALTIERNGTPASGASISLNTPFIASSILSNLGSTLYVNGELGYSTTFTTKGNFGYTVYNIGRFSGSSGAGIFPWSGLIGEVIAYTSNLDSFQRQMVEGYLAWKWGLQSSLPATNIFRDGPLLPKFDIRKVTPAMELWLDASDPYGDGTLPSTGTGLLNWTDKSYKSSSITANTTPYPTFEYDGSYPAILFTRANSVAYSTTTRLLTGTPSTVFIVARATATSGMLSCSRSGSTAFCHYRFEQTSDTGSTITYMYNAGVTPNVRKFRTYTHGYEKSMFAVTDSGVRTTTLFDRFNRNGEQQGPGLGGTSGSASTANTAWYIGNALNVQTATNNYLDGYIYEVIVFNQQINISEFQQIEGYLAWKWGLQGNLPSTHPYSKYPPY